MRKIAMSVGFLLMLLLAHPGGTSPVEPSAAKKFTLDALGQRSFSEAFVGKQRALAIAIGEGSTFLAMSVFDGDGNCIAHDEPLAYASRDDLAVEWLPPATAVYVIEIRNLGVRLNQAELVLK